jgi:hypothetical protein
VLELHRRAEVLHITPQVLIEFRNVATRPKTVNGAGLSIAEAEAHAGVFSCYRPVPSDTPIPPQQKQLSAEDATGIYFSVS